MNHKNIVNTILSADPGVYRLHADIITEDLENDYYSATGMELGKRKISGGFIYHVGDASFYYGKMIHHPALRHRPLIAA